MDSMYDEFGNYIGPDLDDDDDSSSPTTSHATDDDTDTLEWEQQDDSLPHLSAPTPHQSPPLPPPSSEPSTAVALPTHGATALTRQYYPSAEQLYGADTEVVVGDEDAQPIEQPIIAPVRVRQWGLSESALPHTAWDWRFLAGMMDHPALIRHTALIGALHSGKTALLDLVIAHTHTLHAPPQRYTDTRTDEQARGISIKSQPMSFILPTLSDKSYLVNALDTPGHIDFADERTAALRLADAAVVVVDIAEGLQVSGERALRQAVRLGLRVMLVIAKLDRLIVELRLPPADAYHRLVHAIEEVNDVLRSTGYRHKLLSPAHNNVCFASPAHDYVFSLRSFAKLYCDRSPTPLSYASFARKLWGNQYLLPSGHFSATAPTSSHPRTFVHFVLQPLYKLYSHVLSSEGQELRQLLAELGVEVTAKEMKLQARELLRLVCGRFFGDIKGFTDMVVECTPAASDAGGERVENGYQGSASDGVGRQMSECDRRGQLMLHVTKLYCRADAAIFDAFGRVYSGSVKVGDRVRVLGERYSAEDDEDVSERVVTRIWIFNARYRVEVSGVAAGNWALFEGIDPSITKTATVTSPLTPTTLPTSTFAPLRFDTLACMKVAIEPLHPSDLPKMLDGLRRLDKSYPLCATRVEESGEHVLLGVGELYMDCLLYDLRLHYGDVEVRVSDPVVRFSEGVSEASVMEVGATSANGANRLSMLCEPIERELAEEMESGVMAGVGSGGGGSGAGKGRDEERVRRLEERYGWDVLQSRSIWAFGPDEQGPNMLVDETLPSEVRTQRAHFSHLPRPSDDETNTVYFIDLSCSSESSVMNNLGQPLNFHSSRSNRQHPLPFPTRCSRACCLLAVCCVRSDRQEAAVLVPRQHRAGLRMGHPRGPAVRRAHSAVQVPPPLRQPRARLAAAHARAAHPHRAPLPVLRLPARQPAPAGAYLRLALPRARRLHHHAVDGAQPPPRPHPLLLSAPRLSLVQRRRAAAADRLVRLRSGCARGDAGPGGRPVGLLALGHRAGRPAGRARGAGQGSERAGARGGRGAGARLYDQDEAEEGAGGAGGRAQVFGRGHAGRAAADDGNGVNPCDAYIELLYALICQLPALHLESLCTQSGLASTGPRSGRCC